jgi:hypothetical protein
MRRPTMTLSVEPTEWRVNNVVVKDVGTGGNVTV